MLKTLCIHLFASPFIGFFLMLLWAVLFGDTIVYWYEKNMLEEWVICVVLYLVSMVLYTSRKKESVDE